MIDDPALLGGSRGSARRFRDGLAVLDGVVEVRGRGLMVGRHASTTASTPARSVARRSTPGW